MESLIMTTSYSSTGFCCSCDVIPGWVVTGSGNFSEFKKEVEDSLSFFVECAREDGDPYPAILDGEYRIIYKFDARSILMLYQRIISFSALESMTGINQKQLSHYAAGRTKPRKEQVRKIADGLHRLAEELMSVTA